MKGNKKEREGKDKYVVVQECVDITDDKEERFYETLICKKTTTVEYILEWINFIPSDPNGKLIITKAHE